MTVVAHRITDVSYHDVHHHLFSNHPVRSHDLPLLLPLLRDPHAPAPCPRLCGLVRVVYSTRLTRANGDDCVSSTFIFVPVVVLRSLEFPNFRATATATATASSFARLPPSRFTYRGAIMSDYAAERECARVTWVVMIVCRGVWNTCAFEESSARPTRR